MISSLRQRWNKAQFQPGWAGFLVNPFCHARAGLYEGLSEFLPHLMGRVLDLGCGQMPYRNLVHASNYVGIDIDSDVTRRLGKADILYDGRRLPFEEGTFDGVLCSQVLEHVFQPDEFVGEIHRVLVPGGLLVLATPFIWDEHEQPCDFGRYTSFGLKALLERHGFTVINQRKTCPDFRTVVQLTSGSLYKILRTKSRTVNMMAQLLILAPVNLLGGLLARALPSNEDLYLDNLVLARRRDEPPARL